LCFDVPPHRLKLNERFGAHADSAAGLVGRERRDSYREGGSAVPILLKDRDISSEIASIRSALIVPCRFCPAANLAVREHKPYIDLFRRFMRTESFESYVGRLKSDLTAKSIRTEVFDSRLPYQFIMCMWTSTRRNTLATHAAGYDAAIVLGCDAAVDTVRYALESTDCRVISGMEVDGIMNVKPSVRFPLTITLEVNSVTHVLP
jgi:hypothetical protein